MNNYCSSFFRRVSFCTVAVIVAVASNSLAQPTINIVSPATGEDFTAPANILVLAGVQDRDGNAAAATVEFFLGDHKIGNGQLTDPGPLHAAAFRFEWNNVPPGEYDLSGKVTDEKGASAVSDPVHVSVRNNPPTNQPPTVQIATPINGATFTAPANVLICAAANDLDGYVATVEFFAGDHSLGILSNLCPACAGPANPFCLVWSNVPPGSYELRAKATDNVGAMAVSDPVNITVTQGPPPTNQPPTVHIVTPTNGATFFSDWFCPPCTTNVPPCEAPCYLVQPNITICADARDPDGDVDYVEFFAGNIRIGARTNCLPCPSVQNPFCVVWSNVPPGAYVLTARVTDNGGAMTTSEPIRISVMERPPRLPLVTIIATDPYATEPCQAANPPSVLDNGRFIIRRDSGTNVAFQVYYAVSGTASNGVDYTTLSGTVEIPAGHFETDILVNPLADALVEGQELVVLQLQPIACIAIFPPPPDCYQIGVPGEAAVYIRDCEPHVTNAPPRALIITPTNGSVFVAPVNIPILADTVDVDGYVWWVEFFANDQKIGEDSKYFLIAPPDGSHIGYDMVWSNPPPGLYALRAKAYDAAGASAFSEPVRISILGTNSPPPTDLLPVVTIAAVDGLAAEGTNCWRWYTNLPGWNESLRTNYSGPNTATFVVRRSGPTNASLTVPYAIGGSASNGVDYAELPGVVIIPAGERSARITVIPRDDALPECTETVILGLMVSSHVPPDYRIGWPGKAAAIIVDNDQPPPDTRLLCDGIFHLSLPAPNGFHYRLECSLDMIHWVPVSINTVTEFNIRFVEPETKDFPSRFYRVVPETAPPPP